MADWRLMPWLHQLAIVKVVEQRGFLSSKEDPNLFRNMSDAELTRSLNLWRPCRGSVPEDLIESDRVEAAVIEKFGTLLTVAGSLAEQYWFHKKTPAPLSLNTRVLVQPGFEQGTAFLAWDTQRQRVLLEDCQKAWDFHFHCLAAISNQVVMWAGTMLDKTEQSGT